MKPDKHVPHVTAYAWTILLRGREVLCNWAEPNKARLAQTNKPSDESRMAKVVLVPFNYIHELTQREKTIAARERRCASLEYNSEQYLKMKREQLGKTESTK